jgi:hypothetical protein
MVRGAMTKKMSKLFSQNSRSIKVTRRSGRIRKISRKPKRTLRHCLNPLVEEEGNRKISQRRRTRARFSATIVTNMGIMPMNVKIQRKRKVKTMKKRPR